MSKIFLTILILLSYTILRAQATFSGSVRDNKNNPITGASVTLKDTYDGGITDSLGNFRFVTTEKGMQTLVVTAMGYNRIEQPVNLAETLQPFSFSLKEAFNELKAVVISAGSFEASDRKRAAAVLSSLDIVTTASANGDVTGALRSLPGAQQVGEAEGLFVRGGTAAETKYFIDGTLVNRFFLSSGPNIQGYGRFNPFLFKGTVFSTGGYSALYGQALSSAVILESIDLPDQTSATLSASVLSLGGGFQKLNKKKNASYGINYDYSNLGLAFKLIQRKQDYSTAPVSHNIDANFRIKTSSFGMLKYYGVVTTNKLAFTTPSIDSAGYLDGFALDNLYIYHNLSWKERLGTYWKFFAGVAYTNNRDDISGKFQNAEKHEVTYPGFEYKNYDLRATGNYLNSKAVFERRLRGLSAIRLGGEYNYSKDKSRYKDYQSNRYTGNVTDNISSLFAESDIYVTNAIAAKLGARLEHSTYLDKTNIAPRASLAYKTGVNSQASIAYGMFFQNPETRYLPSTADLRFSRADHYIAQYQKTSNQRVFRAEAYYKDYHNLVKTGFSSGRDGSAVSTEGFGDAKGFEVFYRDKKTIKNLDFWISYSYLDTKRNYLNFPYAITPNFAAKHTANFVVKKFITPIKTQFNLAYNYATGRPYYNLGYSNGSYKFTDRGRVQDYNNVSFSVNYIPSIGKTNSKTFVVYVLSVSNVLNLKQTYGYQYSSNGLIKQAIEPPSRSFIYIGAFFSFGIDRTEDAINNNL